MTEPAAAPARRSAGPLFAAAVILLVAVLGVEGFILLRGGKPKASRPREAERAIASASNEIVTFGEAAAPIKVEFYAPLTLEWHQQTIGLLREYDEAHPGLIHVTLMPMGRSDCDQEMLKRGYTCAVIFINGQNEFALPDGRKVSLEKKPNTADSFYSSEDVITILDQLAKTRRG